MSRALRIEYPGAWYHVMNRGRRVEKIFYDNDDYQMFVDLLEETSEMWNIRVAAYCLMPNHYHILIQTPEANISRSMRHINGVYTQRFNRKHSCDGQLFRGRYKSILVSADNYLLQLVRYIHRNPVKSGVVDKLDDYVWSSHKGYLSVAKKWNWLNKAFIFSMLTKNRQKWLTTYRKFICVEDDEEIDKIFESKKWPFAIGPEKFIDWVKGKYYAVKAEEEVPQAKELAPEAELIIQIVCEFYNVSRDDILKSQRGVFNEARNVSIYLLRRLRHDSLKQIGGLFQMEKYSSISSIIERMKKQMPKDRNLEKRINNLAEKIAKSQEQT